MKFPHHEMLSHCLFICKHETLSLERQSRQYMALINNKKLVLSVTFFMAASFMSCSKKTENESYCSEWCCYLL